MSSRKPNAPRVAAIYVRLSVHRGDADPSVSPAAQEERCRAYAAAKGWEVVEVVRDLDVSGSDKGLRLDRPGLRRVREILPGVDVVIFAKLDRLARNVVDFRRFAEEAEAEGATLVSVAESLDLSTPSGRFVATILASFAEMEAATIAERVTTARAALVRLGRYAGGNVPFGYRPAPDPEGPGRVLVVDPHESAVITEAAERVVAGESLYALCQDFNARGDRPKRGGTWRPGTLADTLRGDFIVGRVTHRGELLRGEDGLPLQVWEPALDPALWRAVRATLDTTAAKAAATAKGPRRRRASRLLSGLAYCSSCNRRLQVRSSRTGPIYACTARANGYECERGTTVLAERVEEYVAERFLAVAGSWPAVRVEHVGGDSATLGRLADAEDALTDVMARLRDADEDEEPGLLAQRRTLRALIAELRDATSRPTTRHVETGLTTAEEWEIAETPGRRALIEGFLDAVVIHPAIGRSTKPDPRRFEILWAPDLAPIDAE